MSMPFTDTFRALGRALSPRLTVAAALAGALVAGGCNSDPSDPFEPSGTGAITGQLFFDADNNGQFTPIGGDTALVGVQVQLLARASDSVLASTTTSASGAFTFADVPLGTMDVRVVTDPAVTGALVFCQNPSRASVYRGENVYLAVSGKLGCVISIASAEAKAAGSTVTVAGVVTAGQGTFRTASDNLYLQDATGGVQVFGLQPAQNLVEGDSIEVTGTLTLFSGEWEITSPRVAANVKHGATVPPARVRTAAQITGLSVSAADVGRLITVKGVTVGAFGSGTSGRNATATDSTGSFQIRLDGGALVNVGVGAFVTGHCYDVTGVLGLFNGTTQLKPRKATDVAEVACS